MRKQQTLKTSTSVRGVGYWSGQTVTLHFLPAAENYGITFTRTDLATPVTIPATTDHTLRTPRRTVIQQGKIQIEMIEHVMAALAGLQIDNCQIQIDGAEVPGLDGSSRAYAEALTQVGTQPQTAERASLQITEHTLVQSKNATIEAIPIQEKTLILEYHLDYGDHNYLKPHSYQYNTNHNDFLTELAPARTFILEHEAKQFLEQGVAQHVSLDELLVLGEQGPLHNELHFPDECARHKVLDMLGDFATAPYDLFGHFIARQSGHQLNAELAAAILASSDKSPHSTSS